MENLRKNINKSLDACPFCAGPPSSMIRDAITAKPFTGLSASAATDSDYLAALTFCHECGAEGPTIERGCYTEDDVYWLEQEAAAAWNVRNTRNADLYQAEMSAGRTVSSIHTPIAPVPNRQGWWTHPGFPEPANGRDCFLRDEFERWAKFNDLQFFTETRDEEEGLDCKNWTPEPPAGDGWFIGAIYDGEDGPQCIWFRRAETKS